MSLGEFDMYHSSFVITHEPRFIHMCLDLLNLLVVILSMNQFPKSAII